MKLDRNAEGPIRRRKYALVLMREVEKAGALEGEPSTTSHAGQIKQALETLQKCGVLDYGSSESTDYFVIRLKDKYAAPALTAYAEAAAADDSEYASEVSHLADLAAKNPQKQRPD